MLVYLHCIPTWQQENSVNIQTLLWLPRPRIIWTDQTNNSGRKIAPDTGANATKFFTLATKSWKLVAKLVTRISNHTLPRDLVIVEHL